MINASNKEQCPFNGSAVSRLFPQNAKELVEEGEISIGICMQILAFLTRQESGRFTLIRHY
jgi:hypothetical protein